MLTKSENTKSASHASKTAKMKNTPFFQPQLQVGTPGDKYEIEADKVADQVVNETKGEQESFIPPAVTPKVQSKPAASIPSAPVAKTISPLLQKQEDEEEMLQMQPAEEEEMLQAQADDDGNTIQQQPEKEEDFVAKREISNTLQRQSQEEEETLQMQPAEEEDTFQMQPEEEEETLQMQAEEEELQTKPEDKKKEPLQKKEGIQAKDGGNEVSSGFESDLSQSKGGGSPLPEGVKSQMESGFGTDFGNVRVHTDSNAVQMNREVGAQAFTHGSDIYFNKGKYDTSSSAGKHLLAHELTHVIQQTGRIQKKQEIESIPSEQEQGIPLQPNFILESELNDNADGSMGSIPDVPENSIAESDNDLADNSTEIPTEGPVSSNIDFSASSNTLANDAENTAPNADIAEPDILMSGDREHIQSLPSYDSDTVTFFPSQPEIQLKDEDDEGIMGGLRSRFNRIVSSLRTGWSGLTQMAGNAFRIVLSQVNNLTSGLRNIASSAFAGIQSVWSEMSQMATQMTNSIKHIASGALSAVMGPISSISQAVLNLDALALRAAWRRITGLIGNVWQRIKHTGQTIFQRIQRFWQRLRGRFTRVLQSLTSRARAIFNQMRMLSQRIRQRIVVVWNGLRNIASRMSGIFGRIARGLLTIVNNLIGIGQRIWDNIKRSWNLLNSRIGSFFKRIFNWISVVWQRIRQIAGRFWNRLTGMWNRLKGWVLRQILRFTSGLQNLWRRFSNFSIGSVVEKIEKYAPFIRYLREAVANPDSVMEPLVEAMAIPLQNEMPGKAITIGREKASQQFHTNTSGGSSSAGVIQMKVDSNLIQLTRGTASIYEVNDGMLRHIREKWSQIEVWKMLKDMLWTLLWPWPTVGHEIYAFFAEDLYTIFFNNLFATRNLFADPLGFLHDIYTNLLHLGDIPLALWRRINNIGMALLGWLTLALVIIGAVGGSVAVGIIGAILSAAASLGVASPAGGAAGAATGGLGGAGLGFAAAMAIGEVLVASFVGAHGLSIIKAFIDLFTGNQTDDEKESDYSQIADSLIGIGITAVLVFAGWVASKFAAAVLSVIRRIRGPRPAETAPVETAEPVSEGGESVPEESVPQLSGRRPPTPEHPVVDANGVLTEYGRWYYEKPPGLESGFRTNTKAEIWEQARAESSDGIVRDPVSGEEIPPDSNWRVEVRPDDPFSARQQSAAERGISREEFLDEYNDPQHYRVREERSSGSEFSGERPPAPEQPVLDTEGVLTEYGRWYYERPSGYRNGVRETVWENAASESIDGVVRDPITGEEILPTDPWQMGHRYGYEFWKHRQSAAERGISRETFLDEHNNPNHYRPETPESNSSHQGEAPPDVYYGD